MLENHDVGRNRYAAKTPAIATPTDMLQTGPAVGFALSRLRCNVMHLLQELTLLVIYERHHRSSIQD